MSDVKTLINVKKIKIITEEATPRNFGWETVTKIGAKATISKGTETECRKLNTVYGKEKSEDIVTGYEVEADAQTLEPEIMALVDGGKLRYDTGEPEKVIGYDAPKSGEPIVRIPFTTEFYAEDKDTDGSTKGYTKVTIKNCKGSPMDWDFEDGKFSVPKFKLTSSPKLGESPISIDFVDDIEE